MARELSDIEKARTHGRFPKERRATPEELHAWAAKAVANARELCLIHENEGDGFVYFAFQDRAGGLVDPQPIYGRAPIGAVCQVIAQRARIGSQMKVVQGKSPVPGAPGVPGSPERVN